MKEAIRSYTSPKITIADSPIHGKGMFAAEKIYTGEITFIKAGHIIPKNSSFSLESIKSDLAIDDNFYLGALTDAEMERIRLYLNHSCDPNCGVRGEITFVAMRDIPTHEELTIDYAMVDNDEYAFVCSCGSPNCRKLITGSDWKLPQLQERYGCYFSRYLLEKIKSK